MVDTQYSLADQFHDQTLLGTSTADILKQMKAAPVAESISKVTAALEKADNTLYGDFKNEVLTSVRSLAVGDQVPTKQVIKCLAESGSTNKTIGVSAEELAVAANVLAEREIADPDGTLAPGLAKTASLLANGLNNLKAAQIGTDVSSPQAPPEQQRFVIKTTKNIF